MKIKKLLFYLMLVFGFVIFAGGTSVQASSWHKGVPKSIQKHTWVSDKTYKKGAFGRTKSYISFHKKMVITADNSDVDPGGYINLYYKNFGHSKYTIKGEQSGNVAKLHYTNLFVKKIGKNKLHFYASDSIKGNHLTGNYHRK